MDQVWKTNKKLKFFTPFFFFLEGGGRKWNNFIFTPPFRGETFNTFYYFLSHKNTGESKAFLLAPSHLVHSSTERR